MNEQIERREQSNQSSKEEEKYTKLMSDLSEEFAKAGYLVKDREEIGQITKLKFEMIMEGGISLELSGIFNKLPEKKEEAVNSELPVDDKGVIGFYLLISPRETSYFKGALNFGKTESGEPEIHEPSESDGKIYKIAREYIPSTI